MRLQETADELRRSAILLGYKTGPRARPASSRILTTAAGPPNRGREPPNQARSRRTEARSRRTARPEPSVFAQAVRSGSLSGRE